VVDSVLRADAKKLPVYVGTKTPAGYSLVKVTKVIDVEKIDDKRREGLGTQLRSAVAAQEMEASLASVRNRVGFDVRKDAIEKKNAEVQPQQPAQAPRPRGKGGL